MRAFSLLLFVAVALLPLLALAEPSGVRDHAANGQEYIKGQGRAPFLLQANRTAVIPGAYIVTTSSLQNTDRAMAGLTRALDAIESRTPLADDWPRGLKMRHATAFQYQAAMHGFATKFEMELPAGGMPANFHRQKALDRALDELLALPEVVSVEEDSLVQASAIIGSTDLSDGSLWNLDRIDQRELVGTTAKKEYTWDATGRDSDGIPQVHVYIIDTGIYAAHEQFQGRATADFNAVTLEANVDLHGHGTHCAGSVGGARVGVAKNVRLHGVKVLGADGSGSNSGVVAGIDWVRMNAIKPAVASMSLGGGISSATDNAVNNLALAGVAVAVAAGNENQDACNTSPARAANVFTVAASTITDAKASFSNWGSCVDIYAPGTNILSAYAGTPTGLATMSGTSMATPQVAGAMALVLEKYPAYTAKQVRDFLTASSTKGAINGNVASTVNNLLFSLVGDVPTTVTPIPDPVVPIVPVPPTGPSESEQCAVAGSCTTFSGASKKALVYSYTTHKAGTHRSWLTYTPGSGSKLQMNSLMLKRRNPATSLWDTLASVTDATGSKAIAFATTLTGDFQWQVQPLASTPMQITRFTYKLP
jgi:hypothetical protein